MRIGILNDEMKSLFEGYDPYRYLERTKLPGYLCLLAVSENQESESEQPMGLMIVREADDAVIVEWLFVRDDHRREQTGSVLLESAFGICRQKGFQYLLAYVKDEDYRSSICPGEMDFLDDFNFFEVRGYPGEWMASVGEMLQLAQKSAVSSEYDLKMFGELSPIIKSHLYKEIPKKDEADTFNGVQALNDGFVDEEISVAGFRGKQLKGTIMARFMSDSIYITCLYLETIDIMDALMERFLTNVKLVYGEEMQVCVLNHNWKNIVEIAGFFPEGGSNAALYASDVESYYDFRQKFAAEDMMETFISTTN